LLALCKNWNAAFDRLVKARAAVDHIEQKALAAVPLAIRRRTPAARAAGYENNPPPANSRTFQYWHDKGIPRQEFIGPEEIRHRIAVIKEAGCQNETRRIEDSRDPDGVGTFVIGTYTRRLHPLTTAQRRSIAREERRLAVALRFVARPPRVTKLEPAKGDRYWAMTQETKLLEKIASTRAHTAPGVLAKIAVLQRAEPDVAQGLEYEEGLLAAAILRETATLLAQV
jgi:hypothetical protein